jgi:hypothetical protein
MVHDNYFFMPFVGGYYAFVTTVSLVSALSASPFPARSHLSQSRNRWIDEVTGPYKPRHIYLTTLPRDNARLLVNAFGLGGSYRPPFCHPLGCVGASPRIGQEIALDPDFHATRYVRSRPYNGYIAGFTS